MKRIISTCLAMMCIVFSLGFTSCDENLPTAPTEMFIDNPGGLMFNLEGVSYTLPVRFSELEANGWRLYDIDDHSVRQGPRG